MELFRTIFDSDATLTDEEESLKQAVTNDMGKQMQILRGQDKDGRAVVIKVSRTHGGTTEYDYVTQQLFVAEKSAAVTEFVSKGHQDTVCAIFSMQNQNSSYTPSLAWQLSVIKLLQQIAPGRMGRVLILEASFMIRQIFNAIRPFLSVSLKESTFLVAGKAREAKLKETLDDYEILTKDGELTKPVDVNKYLNETPFYCPYEYSV